MFIVCCDPTITSVHTTLKKLFLSMQYRNCVRRIVPFDAVLKLCENASYMLRICFIYASRRLSQYAFHEYPTKQCKVSQILVSITSEMVKEVVASGVLPFSEHMDAKKSNAKRAERSMPPNNLAAYNCAI